MGIKPMAAILAVISTGLNRENAPANTASSGDSPPLRRWFIALTMTTPFKAATLNSAINPMDPGTVMNQTMRRRLSI